jgi:DNA polymerase-3 subunit delta'
MSFDSIAGQDGVVGALRRALRSGRVAHAYIFAGLPGVGKMTTARAFAQALVCRERSDDACGECPPCRKVARETHPDVHVLAPEGAGRQIRIRVVRERIQNELALKPFEAPCKVVLIDDAHAMNDNAANCLLKTLEEPPPDSVLVLVTPRPDSLPETILSRAHMLRFALLPPNVIQERLEDRGIDPSDARFLARSAGGSLGRALEMAEEGGPVRRRGEVFELATGLAERNITASAAAFVAMVREESTSRAEARTTAEWLLDLIEQLYRDVALRQLGADDQRLCNVDAGERIDAETGIRPRGIRAILDTIEETKRLLRSNVDLDAAVLDAFSKIAYYRAQQAEPRPTAATPRRR